MKIGVITRGKYGHRVIDTIKKRTDMSVVSTDLPDLPDFIDYPEEIVKEIDKTVFDVDLLISYALHPDINPEIVKAAGKNKVKAIMIPGGMSRAGGFEELERISEEYDIFVEVSEICCSLGESEDETINEYASKLGRPIYKVETKDGKISGVEVIRGSPCGDSWWVAEQLIGEAVEDAPSKAGLLTQIYPCRASRGIDGKIHTSAEIHKKAIKDALSDGSDQG
ncbi:MAG: DUF166 family protein [Halobacteriota archaeon]|nr:DUF166 family protein [Halobacteriota archaeon]